MGVFDFLKKHDSQAIAPPSVPSGVSPISRSDEKLAPMPPKSITNPSTPTLPPPTLPPQRSAPVLPAQKLGLPPLPNAPSVSVDVLPLTSPTAPALPPMPAARPIPAVAPIATPPALPPLPAMPPKMVVLQTPTLPPMPTARSEPPAMPVARPAPSMPSMPALPSMPAARPPLPSAINPNPVSSGPQTVMAEKPFVMPPALQSTPKPAPSRVPMPQVTPLISSKQTPLGQLPVQELRKVIAELRDIPLDMPAVEEPKPVAVVEAPKLVLSRAKHAYIPAQQFDESIIHIRGIHAAASVVQAGNEKVGSIETQAKAATDALAAACDSIQSALLSIDEKLFKVN